MKLGIVEKTILALEDLGMLFWIAKVGDELVAQQKIGNKMIALFLDGNSKSKSTMISRARSSLKNKRADHKVSMMEREKRDKYLKEAYLNIYVRLCHAIESESTHILTTFSYFQLDKHYEDKMSLRLFQFNTEELNRLDAVKLYGTLNFLSQITHELRKRLGLPRFPITMSQIGTYYNQIKEAKHIFLGLRVSKQQEDDNDKQQLTNRVNSLEKEEKSS